MSIRENDPLPGITVELIEHGVRQARRERALAFASTLKIVRDAFRLRLVIRRATQPEAAEAARPVQ